MHLVAAGSTGLFSGFITGSKGIIGPTALQSGAIFALVTIVSNAAIRILQAYGIHPNWGMKCLLDVAVFTLISPDFGDIFLNHLRTNAPIFYSGTTPS